MVREADEEGVDAEEGADEVAEVGEGAVEAVVNELLVVAARSLSLSASTTSALHPLSTAAIKMLKTSGTFSTLKITHATPNHKW